MADDQRTPTEPGATQTDPQRPLGRQLALEATLHEVFGVGDKPTKTIARYQIEGRLGAGGMSEVFLATDPELRRRVAVKVLNQRFAADQQERLLREGWALASVTHPNVVAVYDVGVDRGRAFLVMEHVEGTTLDVWLSAAPRSLPEILTLLIRVADGLAVVHDRGVVHRDLKPQN
ncbi:MAG: serine/threonine protein kinase, partial [Myxococcales bacterium]|nr:serine/threonine protein kinase [Myxococcales bacterium]